jgi:hypothetical protein
MQQLLGNQVDQNNDDDSSSNKYNCMNVDSDSGTDIDYETDITEGDADTDAVEDNDGDEDHDVSDFAKLFADNEHSLEYPTKFLSGEAVLPPRVIYNNGVDGATMDSTTFSPLTTYPTAMDDKVGDMDDPLGTENECSVEKSIQETIGIPSSYKEALTSRHSDKWKEAMAKEIEEIGCWRLVRHSTYDTYTRKMDRNVFKLIDVKPGF